LKPSRRAILAAAASGLVLASVLAAGGAAAFQRLRDSLRAPQEVLFPAEMTAALPAALRIIPPDAPVLYIGSESNTWRCGLWQRALYPRLVFCLRPAASSRLELPEIRKRFRLRYAIGSAPPPPDVSIAGFRKITGEVWIGEISP
jgi:hypothetical protein